MARFQLTTKSVYDPQSPDDGTRVLVMRMWPRGIPKAVCHLWFRDLGTTPELIHKWKTGSIRWPQFRREYLRGLQDPAARQAISEIRKLLAAGTVTLLCGCRDESRCHRSILKEVIEQQPSRSQAARAKSSSAPAQASRERAKTRSRR
jgi:uncharacterized protein YeaO (DUF488 family)